MQWFRNFLVLYAAAVKGDDLEFAASKYSRDVVNAPFMHEIEMLPEFIKVIDAQPQEQRVEMRRFEAQRCVGELLDELRILFNLLEESRSGKKYSIGGDGKLVQRT